MKLGAFSISLNVKNIKESQKFYEKLGFTIFHGDIKNNYLILKNESSIIGLFQDMIENNIITFNPGWDENAEIVEEFDDVRFIQKELKNNNIKLISETDEAANGPANILLVDPDGNQILIDQHV